MENIVRTYGLKLPAKACILRLQHDSGPQIVQQITTVVWSSQLVLNFWYKTKPCPQPKTRQRYGTYHS